MAPKGSEAERFLQNEAFRASIQGLSKKGTYDTDDSEYDSLDWAMLPPPASTAKREQAVLPLARGNAIIARKRGGLPEDTATKAMIDLREELYKSWPGHFLYFYMGPPILEDFSTEYLGTGVKVWCAQKAPKRFSKAVAGLLGYAFRDEELETDLHLKAMCPDLGWLQGAMPHIDEFVRAISIVPKQQKAS